MVHPDFMEYADTWDAKRRLADTDPAALDAMKAAAHQEWIGAISGAIALVGRFDPIEAPSFYERYGDRRDIQGKTFTTGLLNLGELPHQTYDGRTHGVGMVRVSFRVREVTDIEPQPRHRVSLLRGQKPVRTPRYDLDPMLDLESSSVSLYTSRGTSLFYMSDVADASLPKTEPHAYDERERTQLKEYMKLLNIVEASLTDLS